MLSFFSASAFAFVDPTDSEPFLPWVWEEQLKPTMVHASEPTGLWIIAAGLAASEVVHEYDDDIYFHNAKGKNLIIDHRSSSSLAVIGSGVLGVGIAVTQIAVDSENGLLHARALILTSLSHLLTAALIQRERPGGREDYLPFKSSFPSGHTSSAFATAASLGYAYGWKVGVPSFLVASAVGLARVSENAHWASDVVFGAFLGVAWARASNLTVKESKDAFFVLPVMVEDQMLVSCFKTFP